MIRAIVTNGEASTRFSIQETPAPRPRPWEALVQVKTVSLNRGEVSDAVNRAAGFRPGWDFAGTVIRQAATGEGPPVGSKVAGLAASGAWAEQIAVPALMLAELPGEVSFTEAAALPVAGLTALYSLRKGGMLLGRRILITGSTGGVGLSAHQLAALSGAYTVGTARSEDKAALVTQFGADEVFIGELSGASALQARPFHHILDTVGGNQLNTLLSMLAPGGLCVSAGHTAGAELAFQLANFRLSGGRTLYSFFLGEEMNRHSPAEDLRFLAELVAQGRLKLQIGAEAPWEEAAQVADQLIGRGFSGKAVLHLP